MSTIDIERDTVKERKPERKTRHKPKVEEPKQHKVIMEQKSDRPVLCTECILRVVFHMSSMDSKLHAVKIAMHGRDTIMVAPKEVAEEKAGQVNSYGSHKSGGCKENLRTISARTEPEGP